MKEDKDSISRRDFLKLSGFSLAAATVALSGCESTINKAIPYLVKPDGITPGIPNYYASTFYDGHDYCSILVKTREGRPIKIEGNTLSNISAGGTNARVQASVLSLYDDFRLRYPLKSKQKSTWETVDSEIIDKLKDISNNNGKIVILTSSVISPSTKNVFNDFINTFPTAEIITYDAISASGIIEANDITFGKPVLPTYKLNNADLIVSFGADFLGTWIAPIEFTRQYAGKRKISKENTNISKHVQFESTLSLTGSNADFRVPMNPSDEGKILTELYQNLTGIKNLAGFQNLRGFLSNLADELKAKKGKALVISGSNDIDIQILVNKINQIIDSYGNTIDLENPSYYMQGVRHQNV